MWHALSPWEICVAYIWQRQDDVAATKPALASLLFMPHESTLTYSTIKNEAWQKVEQSQRNVTFYMGHERCWQRIASSILGRWWMSLSSFHLLILTSALATDQKHIHAGPSLFNTVRCDGWLINPHLWLTISDPFRRNFHTCLGAVATDKRWWHWRHPPIVLTHFTHKPTLP